MAQQPIVLITFSCQSGDTEKLALGAAVGAVQARALIRLRRLPDSDTAQASDTLIRMRKEYVVPAEKDILGADALIFASSSDVTASSEPWQSFLDLLWKLHGEGKLNGKVGAGIGGVFPIVAQLGFVTIAETPADPIALGRRVADKARSLKST
jgi:multimeric flavodoxin WrbA